MVRRWNPSWELLKACGNCSPCRRRFGSCTLQYRCAEFVVETGDGPETESDEDVPLRRDWYTGDIARFWTCPYHNCDAQFEHANACIDHFQNTHLSSISSPRPERLQCTLLLCVKSIDESWKVKTQLVKHQLPKNQDKRAPKKATGFSFGKRLRSLFGYSDDSEEETQPTKKRRRTLTLRRHGIRQVCRTYVQESNISGTGVFAESLITEGMVIAEYSGEPISNAVADRRERGYRREGIHNYLMRLNEDTVIDPSNDDGIAKLINHSCDPNCKAWTVPGSAREDVETVRECIDIVALRVINQDEELTLDYGWDREELMKANSERKACQCRAENCRGFLY